MKSDPSIIAIFMFYDLAQGAQAKLSFSQVFRHCNVVVFDGAEWIMIEYRREGLVVRQMKVGKAERFLEHLSAIPECTATISVSVTERKRFMWTPWLVRSCNEICRYATGVDIGWTFNPAHLYSKLIKFNHRSNYEILTHWRRTDGTRKRSARQPDGRSN